MAAYRVPVLGEFSWQQPVKDKDLADAPGAPSKGDRYIVASGTTTGDDWFGHTDDIATYDGAAWQFDTPVAGWFVWIDDEDCLYHFTGVVWDIDDISALEIAVAANTGNIATNTADIATNVSDISDNADDIAANKGVYVSEYGAIVFTL